MVEFASWKSSSVQNKFMEREGTTLKHKYALTAIIATIAISLVIALLLGIGTAITATMEYKADVEATENMLAGQTEYSTIFASAGVIIPQNMQDALAKHGYTLELTKEAPTGLEKLYGDKLGGRTDVLNRVIIIRTHQNDTYMGLQNFVNTFFHEYGKAVSYTYGRLADSDEFKDAYKEGKKNDHELFSKNDIASPTDYFAESFARYLLERDKMERQYPVTAKYFEKLFVTAGKEPTMGSYGQYLGRSLSDFATSIDISFFGYVFMAALLGIAIAFGQYNKDKMKKQKEEENPPTSDEVPDWVKTD